MPRSKKSQVVSLTAVKSRKKEGRREIIHTIKTAVDTYDYIWVYSVDNMRNQYLKKARRELSTSRFLMGSNRVMAKALGTTVEEELKDNLHKVSAALVGDVGLLCTNQAVDEVKKVFDTFEMKDYARAGNIASYRVVVPAGEVVRGFTKETFPNNMEPQLRALGMHTRLKQGKITIDNDYVICEEGDKLTPNQSHLLKHFWEKMATFKIKLVAHWHQSGEFVELPADQDQADATSDQDME
ncbi:mRNA turnover and ribosome assembly protein [Coemansia sp. RSA 552]|nr:mRNA turnover and ribosome assembly protein [Coemansia sp. RSA 552]